MKRTPSSLLAFLLALVMLLSMLASCTGGNVSIETTDGTSGSDSTSSESNGSESESESTTPGGDNGSSDNTFTGNNAELITNANTLANGVQAYFPNADRTHYSIENTEMVMNYARSNQYDQLVESIKNKNGATYIQNTMDVFVRMTSGDIYYASQSTKSAEANLYRFGYYYYEGLFEFQNFVPKDYTVSNQSQIDLKAQYNTGYDVSRGRDGDAISFTITNDYDPRFMYDKNFSYNTDNYNVFVLRAKAIGSTSNLQLYIKTNKSYNNTQSIAVSLINDGEYHDYYISLFNIPEYTGTLTGIRIDPNGPVDSGVAIESMTLGYADIGEVPSNLSINRHFHVYSDKMHQAIQFAVTAKTENIAEVGMLTNISASTVSKLVVVTDDGNSYTSLDAGFSWDDVVAIAFDVNDAGIFGFILPKDDIAGKLRVELKDGNYVIEQIRTPSANGESGVIIPSIDTAKKDSKGNYVHAEGVKNNGNDFYIGQRIYTDASHDFAEFLQETYYERNPLDAKRVNVSKENSNGASFAGYDAMRGIYIFKIATPAGGFYTPYNNPNKDYKVNFSIRSDIDRNIYAMTAGSGSFIECATLMDENMMLLPVPIEVIKNFSEATGERNLYNISDPTFSEAIFYLPLDANKKQEYTLINLYQNWGKYPLKQLSQIPFHCPYYHLSTGVTETNCILPWFGTSNVGKSPSSTLPDFRSMSAPFWQSQPQHNSCGSHSWLVYTDADGNYNMTEIITNTITSYGPTYAELVWDNLSDDGKIKVTYTHMEMPQLDENRSYYTMEYEFLEDLTIDNFKDNFRFYNVTDNNAVGTYKKLGYLNEQNESVVVDANQDPTAAPEYVLGNECPYFTFFMMPDWDRESTSAEGYANVALLIYNSEFVIGGEEQNPAFLIRNKKDNVTLTLNISGTVSFKAGDKITINAILLPWGSQELEDDPANRLNKPHATGYTTYTYSTMLEDGTLYMDKNVRDVRKNTLLNPLTVTSETDSIIKSPFLPKVKSKDGKTAEFTLSGGENNVTVRVYGFNKLTAPKVQEFVDGEWVDYDLSSSNSPDELGNYHYYDGYMVNYDEDGTFSYSFVTTMHNGAPRKFRISADEDFTKWPDEESVPENENFLNIYTDHEELNDILKSSGHMYGVPVLNQDDDGTAYTGIYVKLNNSFGESYSTLYTVDGDGINAGQYLVFKYRVPSSNTEPVGGMQIWSSTSTNDPAEAGNFIYNPVSDGAWHVVVFDLSKSALKSYTANGNGEYMTQLLRVDFFNKQFTNADTHIDVAYIGIDSDLEKICNLEKEKFQTITLVEDGKSSEIDTETGVGYEKTYIDPSSGYTESTLPFGSIIDTINGRALSLNNYTVKKGVQVYYGASANSDMKLVLAGWACVEGGVNKYVWSVDGKTWNTFPGLEQLGNAADAMISNVENANKVAFSNTEAAKKNGNFKASVCPLVIDLSAYAGQKVSITVAAVPEADTSTLVLLYCFENINCSNESIFDSNSQYREYDLAFGSHIDSYNGIAKIMTSGSMTGVSSFDGLSTDENGILKLKGWSVVDGGISKYVYTTDNGKTWHDCTGKSYSGNDAMLQSATKKTANGFNDDEASLQNAGFQSDGLIIDLSAYIGTRETVTVQFCAVPEISQTSVVILYRFIVTLPTTEN